MVVRGGQTLLLIDSTLANQVASLLPWRDSSSRIMQRISRLALQLVLVVHSDYFHYHGVHYLGRPRERVGHLQENLRRRLLTI